MKTIFYFFVVCRVIGAVNAANWQPTTKSQLREAIIICFGDYGYYPGVCPCQVPTMGCKDSAGATITNMTDIKYWDTSQITDMSFLFKDVWNFNQDISAWDVSQVTNMQAMFQNTFFDIDLSRWDVSSVTNMFQMFYSYFQSLPDTNVPQWVKRSGLWSQWVTFYTHTLCGNTWIESTASKTDMFEPSVRTFKNIQTVHKSYRESEFGTNKFEYVNSGKIAKSANAVDCNGYRLQQQVAALQEQVAALGTLQERVANLTITHQGDRGPKGDSGHTFANTTVASIQSLLQNINITTASERACLKARYRTLGTECPVEVN